MNGLTEKASQKQQDEEERNDSNSNQLQDMEQTNFMRVNRAIFKTNCECWWAAKQIMIGSKQAAPGDDTTKLFQALLRDDMSEEEERE